MILGHYLIIMKRILIFMIRYWNVIILSINIWVWIVSRYGLNFCVCIRCDERSPLWVRRSKSEETLCRLLITMVEETFDIRRSWVDHGKQIMNQKSGYVEGENSISIVIKSSHFDEKQDKLQTCKQYWMGNREILKFWGSKIGIQSKFCIDRCVVWRRKFNFRWRGPPDSSVSSLILVGWCEEEHPATKNLLQLSQG